MNKHNVRIELYYTIGDSHVQHPEIFETEIGTDAFRMISASNTRVDTLQRMYGHMVPGKIVRGAISQTGSKKQMDTSQGPLKSDYAEKHEKNENDNISVWRQPYWCIPFRLIWRLFVYTIKTIWGILSDSVKS